MLFFTLINLCIFIVLVFFILYLPGFLILSKVNKDVTRSEIISLSLSLGIVLLVILGVFLGSMHLRYLLLPLLFIMGSISLIRFKKLPIMPWSLFVKKKLLLAIILLGILMQGFISFPSGYQYKDGLLFWSSQGFDGFWHISIMEEIRKNFPPQIPVFAGETLINYHYLSDILMGEYARIFPFFSSLDLYFRFFPVFFSFLMGITIYSFVKRWQNEKIAYWALFFTYFTGSFGYIVTFFRNGQLFGGETAFWVAQLNTVVANPPHAVAIGLLVSFLLSFCIFLEKRKFVWLVISFLLVFMVAGFKVSSGVVLLSGMTAVFIADFILNRSFSNLYLLVLLGVSNLITIKLMTKGVEGYLIFEPWWFVRTMVVAKLGWIDMELKRQHYISKGTWNAYLRVMQLETIAFAIFLVGNIGTRIIGFVDIFRRLILRKDKASNMLLEILILTMTVVSFLVPMLFLQKGIVYNSVQFMQYFLLFLGFYSAIATDRIIELLKNKLLQGVFVILLGLLSVPTVIGNLVELYGPGASPLARVSNEELQALSYLKNNSDRNDVVLSPTFNLYLKDKFQLQPLPIYAWYSTGYISGLTGLRTYLASEDMVMQTGFDLERRKDEVNKFFSKEDFNYKKNFLKDAGVKFVYIPKIQLELPSVVDDLNKIFENSEILIYRVD